MAAINSDFWSLPNPSAFLKRIVDNSIIDGISTIIRFPKTFRKDFYDAIENSFQSIDVKFFSVNSKDALVLDSPLTYLLKTYGKSVNRRNLPSMGSLSKVETLKNSVIFLRETDDQCWPKWCSFLDTYEVFSHSLPVNGRAKFVVPLFGSFDTLEGKICIRTVDWNDCIDDIDIMVFVSNIIRNRKLSQFQREIRIAIISSIALWDTEIAEDLASRELKEILNPVKLLKRIAEKRKWNDSKPAWVSGSEMAFKGKTAINSAFLASIDDERIIRKRIWQPLAQVLLPFIEEQRSKIVSLVENELMTPFETSFGKIETVADMEINHIHHQIKDKKTVEPEIRNAVLHLVYIRNKLAHFAPVSYEDILLCEKIKKMLADYSQEALED
ncbi:hypothetical protein [Mesotoga prima]|uniref:hypothetical protein n=1 Tax=Mesotoga prima TaxID=1184387 RepID=UPI001BD1E6F8|nr:hypothetical protein [Mesotoga prima]HQC14877.1 hypothetical protein [Mesotoga prima]